MKIQFFLKMVVKIIQVDFPMEGTDYDTEAEWKPQVPKISTTWGPEMPEFSRVGAKAHGKSNTTSNLDIGNFFKIDSNEFFLVLLFFLSFLKIF